MSPVQCPLCHLLPGIVRCLDVTDSQGSDQSTVSKVASLTKIVNDPPEHPEDLQTLEGKLSPS